jgi:hypothetical protein
VIGIVTFQEDRHADLVESAIYEYGFDDVLRIDLERSLHNSRLLLEHSGWQISDPRSGRTATGDNLRTIWWRRASSGSSTSSGSTVQTVDLDEAYWAVRWLIESLPEPRFPFGHPHRLRLAENKILQMQTARAVGLQVPATCISNVKEHLSSFAEGRDWLIVKPVSISLVATRGQELQLLTEPVQSERFLKLLEAEVGNPMLFCQERVWKRADVRVFSFPDGSHAGFEIDTSNLPTDQVDWRPDSMKWPHRGIDIPGRLSVSMARYLAAMGLSSGSFDFGITVDDDWVFFECNPNGQWLWLELKTGIELARKVGQLLCAHHMSSH